MCSLRFPEPRVPRHSVPSASFAKIVYTASICRQTTEIRVVASAICVIAHVFWARYPRVRRSLVYRRFVCNGKAYGRILGLTAALRVRRSPAKTRLLSSVCLTIAKQFLANHKAGPPGHKWRSYGEAGIRPLNPEGRGYSRRHLDCKTAACEMHTRFHISVARHDTQSKSRRNTEDVRPGQAFKQRIFGSCGLG